MSCRRLWLALPLMLLIETAHGFCTHPRSVAPCSRYRRGRFIIGHNNIFDTTRLSLLGIDGAVDGGDDDDGVQLVSLEGLGNDHEAVGETMAKSVVAWLDAEWMPQEIHVRMGVSVRNSYISCRDGGVDDVAEIMTRVTDDLYDRWSEYNADAFVNAWDVGNYVADYLIAKSGSETCGCSTKIVE
ncbi:hypothetical protein ACHAXA_010026 [Cyclostephanos tholiformis]|uniref:Uncharacterized protein n=1 Tax=Cyclostephanos tholiformis TaxID=382380 RepID=A0ABD3RH27_9STRA